MYSSQNSQSAIIDTPPPPRVALVQKMRNPAFERQRAQEKREEKMFDLRDHRRPPPDREDDIHALQKPLAALGLLVVATTTTSIIQVSMRSAQQARIAELARPNTAAGTTTTIPVGTVEVSSTLPPRPSTSNAIITAKRTSTTTVPQVRQHLQVTSHKKGRRGTKRPDGGGRLGDINDDAFDEHNDENHIFSSDGSISSSDDDELMPMHNGESHMTERIPPSSSTHPKKMRRAVTSIERLLGVRHQSSNDNSNISNSRRTKSVVAPTETPPPGIDRWLVAGCCWSNVDGGSSSSDAVLASPLYQASLKQLHLQQTLLLQQLPHALLSSDGALNVGWVGRYCSLTMGEMALRRARAAMSPSHHGAQPATLGLVIPPPDQDTTLLDLDELFERGAVTEVTPQIREERVLQAMSSFRGGGIGSSSSYHSFSSSRQIDDTNDFGVSVVDKAGFEDTGVHRTFGHHNLASLEALWLKARRYAVKRQHELQISVGATTSTSVSSFPSMTDNEEDFTVDEADLVIDSPRSLLVCVQAGVTVESLVNPLLSVLLLRRHNKKTRSHQQQQHHSPKKQSSNHAAPLASSRKKGSLGSSLIRPAWKTTFRKGRPEDEEEEAAIIKNEEEAAAFAMMLSGDAFDIGGGGGSHNSAGLGGMHEANVSALTAATDDPSIGTEETNTTVAGKGHHIRGKKGMPAHGGGIKSSVGGSMADAAPSSSSSMGKAYLIHELAASYKHLSRTVSQKQVVYQMIRAGIRQMIDAFNVATAKGVGPVAPLSKGPSTSLHSALDARVGNSSPPIISSTYTAASSTSASHHTSMVELDSRPASNYGGSSAVIATLDPAMDSGLTSPLSSNLQGSPSAALRRRRISSEGVGSHSGGGNIMPSPLSGSPYVSNNKDYRPASSAGVSRSTVVGKSSLPPRPGTSQSVAKSNHSVPGRRGGGSGVVEVTGRPGTANTNASSCKSATPYTDLLRRRHKDLIVEWSLQQEKLKAEAHREERIAVQMKEQRQSRIDKARACQIPLHIRNEEHNNIQHQQHRHHTVVSRGHSASSRGISATSSSQRPNKKNGSRRRRKAKKAHKPVNEDDGSQSDFSVYSSCSCMDCEERRDVKEEEAERRGVVGVGGIRNIDASSPLPPRVGTTATISTALTPTSRTYSPSRLIEQVRAQTALREEQRIQKQLEKVNKKDAIVAEASKRKREATRLRSSRQREKAAQAAEFNDRKGRQQMYTALLLEDRNETQRIADDKKRLIISRDAMLQSEERQLKGYLSAHAHDVFEKGRLEVLKELANQEAANQQLHVKTVKAVSEYHHNSPTSPRSRTGVGCLSTSTTETPKKSTHTPDATTTTGNRFADLTLHLLSAHNGGTDPTSKSGKSMFAVAAAAADPPKLVDKNNKQQLSLVSTSPPSQQPSRRKDAGEEDVLLKTRGKAKGALLQQLSSQQVVMDRWRALEELHAERVRTHNNTHPTTSSSSLLATVHPKKL